MIDIYYEGTSFAHLLLISFQMPSIILFHVSRIIWIGKLILKSTLSSKMEIGGLDTLFFCKNLFYKNFETEISETWEIFLHVDRK